MSSWLVRLLRSTRGEGPKPSGLCLWRNLAELQALSSELVAATVREPRLDCESFRSSLSGAELLSK